jgi:peptide/nickel transport system permease protein
MDAETFTLRWGLGLVAALAALAAAAPLLAPYDPGEQLDPPTAMLRPPGTALAAVRLAGGGWLLADRVERRADGGLLVHRRGRGDEVLAAGQVGNLTAAGVADRRLFLLGSDKFGRDVASRMLYGARVSLAIGVVAVALAASLGIALGALAALGGPVLDMLIMRGLDALLAFPWLFLMVAVSALFRPGTTTLVLILGATAWPQISRLVRAELLSLQQREFILAARAMGQRPAVILFRHLLPNALAPVLVQGVLLVGVLILVESALSFLGIGIQPPTPSWGNMILEGQDELFQAWWVATFPGAALALTVIAFNLLGDGLRDLLDPRRAGATLPGS